ncbi:MAG: chloride channel protein, partial [Deltaproteobacteria bacterium]
MTATPRVTLGAAGLLIGVVVGSLCGVASGLLLLLLEHATRLRLEHPWLVYGLPLAGLVMGAGYERFGKPIAAGSNLVIDTLYAGGPKLPARLAPMVLLGTVMTHLFGGSAGREGTAVQMGAGLADVLAHHVPWGRALRRHFLTAGIAGGFASVFGTPLAGTLFALEVVVVGRLEYVALLPALVAAVVGDAVTRSMGVRHMAVAAP